MDSPAEEGGSSPAVVALDLEDWTSAYLWDRSPGVIGLTEVDPSSLGLSTALQEDIERWVSRHPAHAPGADPGDFDEWPSRDDAKVWLADGRNLAYRIAREATASGVFVDIVYGFEPGTPVDQWRGP